VTANTDSDGAAALLVDLASAAPQELMALSSAAHWNQCEDDWRTMLTLGRGWGLRQRDTAGRDALVASTLVLPYGGHFAWLSMVLVLPAFRGRGHAERLLRVALDDLAGHRLQPVLDATPAGRPVYLKEGFVDTWGFERWRRKARSEPLGWGASEARALIPEDLAAIDAIDATVFGCSRLALLKALLARLPRAAWVMPGKGVAPRGYLLGRDGRTALQLGPLVADDEAVATALLSSALRALAQSGPLEQQDVVLDLRDGQRGLATWLRAAGFEPERPFVRMVRGAEATAPGDAGRVVLVAGPELG
jgi:GNAT superfamily N-acetyltransferase